MKQLILVLLAVATIVLSGCKDQQPPQSAPLPFRISLAFFDQAGNDLLDQSIPNHFSPDSIHLYNVVNGIEEEKFCWISDKYPHCWQIQKYDVPNYFLFEIFLESDTAILKLNKNIADTIVGITYSSWQDRKLWYNGIYLGVAGGTIYKIVK